MKPPCSVCDQPSNSLGLCKYHYDRQRYAQKREQILAVCAEWARKNPDRRNAISRRYTEANREKTRAAVSASQKRHYDRKLKWVEENRAKVRETKLAWNSRNPEYVRAMKKRLRPATPAWADLEAIALVYQAARQATVDSGIQHEVDHIIPIRGRAVCGLHVAWNLRVVAASVNRRKSNKFDDVICS